MAGWLDETNRLQLKEIHRFANEPLKVEETLCWDFDGLLREVFQGLKQGVADARNAGRPVASIGIDSWGVDFGLIDAAGQLTGPIVHYRDSRTDGQMEKVFDRVSRPDIFRHTGIQFLPFNTIYQLAALKATNPEQLARSAQFMMIADLIAWKLTGKVTCEYTNATTSQLFNTRKGEWSQEILQALDLPSNLFLPPTEPGTTIGHLLPELAGEWGAEGVTVTAVATHDTGSAVVAVPAEELNFAYLSCGTWSLLGTELPAPVITPESLAENFTNEGGAFGTFRLLKNIMGLWVLQECQRQWQREGRNYDWPALERLALEACPFDSIINVDDERFLAPGNMPVRVQEYCRDHSLPVPASDGEIACCILKSLAARYAVVLDKVERLSGHSFAVLYAVGGGIQNELLCRWTAEALKRPVSAGPAEGTVIGNIGIQLISLGALADLTELRTCIRRSFTPVLYNVRQ